MILNNLFGTNKYILNPHLPHGSCVASIVANGSAKILEGEQLSNRLQAFSQPCILLEAISGCIIIMTLLFSSIVLVRNTATVLCRIVVLGPVVTGRLEAGAWSGLAVGSEAHTFVLFLVNT